MFKKLTFSNTKNITFAVLVAFGWEFLFPFHAAALQAQTQNNTQNVFANQTIMPDMSEPIPLISEQRLPQIQDAPQPAAKKVMTISVTAYSSTRDQCGADPFTTASGTRVHDGTLAANFLPIGTKVRFPDQFGNKIFVVEDRMAARYWQKADIWMPSREAAKQWGNQQIRIEIL
jgi:3D (Asp-Asp-Asp) domain-containing protein